MAGRPSLSGSSPASGGDSPASSTSSRSTMTHLPPAAAAAAAAAASAGDPFPLRPTDLRRYHHPVTHPRATGFAARDAASHSSSSAHDDAYQHQYQHRHDHATYPPPPVAAAAPGGEPDQAGDPKKPRACESCRGLKVRCDPDPADPEGSCRRCAKAGRSCVVTQPTRKRQRKTDSRVTELEKKIDALTASLHAARRPPAGDDHVVLPPLLPHPAASLSPTPAAKAGGADDRVSTSPTEPSAAYNSPLNTASQTRRSHSAAASGAGPDAASMHASSSAPSSAAAAAAAVAPVASAVEPPNHPASTSDWRPVLSGNPIHTTPGTPTHVNAYASNTSMTLHRPNLIRWTPFMTECLEVLQSSPDAAPTDPYFCHLVWTHRLAEEVGIQFNMEDPTAVIDLADPRTRHAIKGFERDIERYRAAVPPALMRPSLNLGFHVLSLYMHEIALRSEEGIEEIRPGMGPPGAGGCVGGGAAREDGNSNQGLNKSCGNKSETDVLRDGGSSGIANGNADGGSSTSNSSNSGPNSSAAAPLTPAHIQALSACIMAIDGIFDAFLGMTPEEVRCLPVFNFVRVAYATVVLIKMHFAAARPDSEMGRIIKHEDLKVDQHLGSLLEKFRLAGEGDRSRPAAKFHLVLSMLRSWFQKQGRATKARSAGAAEEDSRDSGVGATAGTPCEERDHPHRAPPPAQSGHQGAPSSNTSNSSNNSKNTNTYAPPSRPLDVGPAGHQQPQQTEQVQPTFVANTPLQVLSELATNDARGVTVPGTTGRFPGGSAPSWVTNPPISQPFMYDPDAADAVANRGGGVERESGGAFSQHEARGQTRQPPQLQPQQQQWMGSASIDPGNFGDGVVQAMDLTYGGGLTLFGSGDAMYNFDGAASASLDAGGFGDLGTSMRNFGVAEPLWFGSFLESTGMDAQFHQY
ncbi:hypothetical protein MAPG_04106 [Magnaporthiopsis poae ATCC 64411]|uniref:Zn(2)-C6 fungal-type domain-containing protein n=1 Tax=Magnaporthiopsis poae (strain ATCC 64411 / 73-15) TaxID=644358 RepID=A0A0C4DVU3_MAGP6|nr:hypothetical protein MAPG_04106 [Magnaporthiopsis poae ATCC 64411]